MAISWGMQERFKFQSGGAFSGWAPPAVPAVYAITYKRDPHNNPKKHTVLYFGVSDDLSLQRPDLHHSIVRLHTESGGIVEDLYVFICPMSGSTRYERSRVHQRLIAEYQPHGNEI